MNAVTRENVVHRPALTALSTLSRPSIGALDLIRGHRDYADVVHAADMREHPRSARD
jgi:hypothetical protein